MYDLIAPATEVASTITPMAGDGILDLIDDLNNRTQSTVRGLAVTASLIGIVVTFFMSKFSIMKTIVAGLVAGLLCWLVFNITSVRDRFDGDLKSAPAAGSTVSPSSPL